MTAFNRAWGRVSSRRDSMEAPDGCECLSGLQTALLAIPAFCREAELNCSLKEWHQGHLLRATGEYAAFDRLQARIATDYAELRWREARDEGDRCCDAASDLLALWEGVQADEAKEAA